MTVVQSLRSACDFALSEAYIVGAAIPWGILHFAPHCHSERSEESRGAKLHIAVLFAHSINF